jgi:serine/threonine protein phosphatase PrpC
MFGSIWAIGGGTAIGASHQRNAKPNQDAVSWAPRSGRGGRFIAAVSDGHGGSPHYRSEIGARLAVDAAIAALDWFFDDPHTEALEDTLPGEIVAIWRAAVGQHAASDPLPRGEDLFIPYGATLLAVGGSDNLLVVYQIGDGDILLGWPDGRVVRPLPDDEGLIGEQTYSLCLPEADCLARMLLLHRTPGQGWPDFAMLSTDGVSKSFADEAAFMSVGERYRELARGGLTETLRALPDWLTDLSHRGSGDDATMCLAVRGPSGD